MALQNPCSKGFILVKHLAMACLVIPPLVVYGFWLVVRHQLERVRSCVKSALLAVLIFAPFVAFPAQDFDLAALSAVESGDRDGAVGRHGEVSRYQILPRVWRSYTGSRAFRDPKIASQVATAHLACVRAAFASRTGRAASDFDLYVMWNAGAGYYAHVGFRADLVSPKVKDRARRFEAVKRALERAASGKSTQPFSQ